MVYSVAFYSILKYVPMLHKLVCSIQHLYIMRMLHQGVGLNRKPKIGEYFGTCETVYFLILGDFVPVLYG